MNHSVLKELLKKLSLFILFLCFCFGCSSPDDEEASIKHLRNQKAEYIYRNHNESLFETPPPISLAAKIYPWDKGEVGSLPKVTKEHFRCKGSSLNPYILSQKPGEAQLHLYDCGGQEKHSLPLRDGKEFIYPILLELLNTIQVKTQKRVVVSCGHRCPVHNAYADPGPENQFSKHMIGAEVSFYVHGLEDRPEAIIKIIQDFFKEDPRYKGKKDYEEFKRYEKADANVSIPPWYNKEVYLKLYQMREGRNFDNRHPYPYISIQVRHDRDLNEKITYSWDKSHKNFHRW